MTQAPIHPKTARAGGSARALRDGVLQDLLAVSMLVQAAQTRLAEQDTAGAADLLSDASTTLHNNLKNLRTVIRALDGTRRGLAVTAR